MPFQETANATVRIEAGDSRASGFHFIGPKVIVTNHHVVANGAPVRAITENGIAMPLRLLFSSPSNQNDFAIFQVQGDVSPDRFVLQPKIIRPFVRGLDILFSAEQIRAHSGSGWSHACSNYGDRLRSVQPTDGRGYVAHS